MTKILILYASLGAGHISAAKALSEAFLRFPNVEVQSEDALAYSSTIYRNAVIQAYKESSEKFPRLYKAIYEGSDVDELDKSLDSNLTWARLELPFFRRLGELLAESDPDVIVCVQQIPARLLQLMEAEDKTSKPQYVVVTDLVVHSTWLNYGVDGYFLPSELSASLLKQRGVDSSILHVTGIPVNLEVMEPKSKQEMRKRHDLPTDVPVVTLFGGGLNSRRVRAILSSLLESSTPLNLVVVAGRNEDLLETLEDLTDNPPVNLQKFGTIDYVDDLIVASDLIITKAGGLITSEILARGTPMVIVEPIPGQEEQNADAIAAAGAGVQLRLMEMVAPAVLYLLKHPDRLQQMRQSALELGKPGAALNIAEFILKDWRSHNRIQMAESVQIYAE